jgi:hypothetical protein
VKSDDGGRREGESGEKRNFFFQKRENSMTGRSEQAMIFFHWVDNALPVLFSSACSVARSIVSGNRLQLHSSLAAKK